MQWEPVVVNAILVHIDNGIQSDRLRNRTGKSAWVIDSRPGGVWHSGIMDDIRRSFRPFISTS
jgi:hypothetical protein